MGIFLLTKKSLLTKLINYLFITKETPTRGGKMKVVIFGPPAAGKGTAANELERLHGFIQVCSGDILRDHVRLETPLGKQAQVYMNKGGLVPDDLVVDAIKETLNSTGESPVVFDGFPRNVHQAQLLDTSMQVDLAIVLEASDDILLVRLRNRLSCPKCGAPYGKGRIPQQEGICDDCQVKLELRPDDAEDEVNRNRIRTFWTETAPMIDYYSQHDRLQHLNAEQPADQVFDQILIILGIS